MWRPSGLSSSVILSSAFSSLVLPFTWQSFLPHSWLYNLSPSPSQSRVCGRSSMCAFLPNACLCRIESENLTWFMKLLLLLCCGTPVYTSINNYWKYKFLVGKKIISRVSKSINSNNITQPKKSDTAFIKHLLSTAAWKLKSAEENLLFSPSRCFSRPPGFSDTCMCICVFVACVRVCLPRALLWGRL